MKYFAFVCFLVALSGCDRRSVGSRTVTIKEPVTIAIDTALLSLDSLASGASVRHFYDLRGYRPFWSERLAIKPQGDSLIAFVRALDERGLFPEDYHIAALEALRADTVPASALQRLDVLLTDAYLTLYRHLAHGKLDPVSMEMRPAPRTADAEAIESLNDIDAHGLREALARREPLSPQYIMLIDALQQYDRASTDSTSRARREKILLNIERWRWQKPWPKRYVVVNIPAYSLSAVEDDSIWLTTPVIVGRRETPTPLLQSVIRSFVIYPYWHVPHSIATRELLPAIKSDPNYLGTRNFEVLGRGGTVLDADSIQWERYSADHFPFTLRQREGSENTMGIIKFDFANGYNVYLHDTNSKGLFRRSERDLSHGCVRVKDAISLAHYLVKDDDIYVSPEDLDQYLSLQHRMKIDLRKPIALKLEYFTVEVSGDAISFYKDIYKRDSVMAASFFPRVAAAKATRCTPKHVNLMVAL